MTQKHTAVIQKYNLEQGYGFLIEENGSRHFFHVTNCKGFFPAAGMQVSFEIGEGKKGPAAVNIVLIDQAVTQ